MDAFGRAVAALFRFFFGTRLAAQATIVVAALILASYHPEWIARAVHNLLAAVINGTMPFVPAMIVIALVIYAFKLMTKGLWKSAPAAKKKKK